MLALRRRVIIVLAAAPVVLLACREGRPSDSAPARLAIPPPSRVVDAAEPGPALKDDSQKPGPAVQVDVQPMHVCAVLASGKVACWGELHGSLEPLVTTPVFVQGVTDAVEVANRCARLRTGGVACWGEDLSARLVPGSDGAVRLLAGSEQCFITAQRTVDCVDANLEKRPVVGLNDILAARLIRRDSWCSVKTDGQLVCQGAQELGKVPDLRDAVGLVFVDRSLACAARAGGQLACFSSFPNELERAPTAADQLYALGRSDCLRSGGTVRCRERNTDAWREMELGGAASDLSCASNACCAVVGGAIACWGWNREGRLGDGVTAFARDPVRVDGLPPIARLAVGDNMTFAVERNGAVYTWGDVGSGQRVPQLVPGNGEFVAAGEVTAAVARRRTVTLYGREEDRRQRGTRWAGETLPELPADVRSLAVEAPHRVCAALVDRTVRCLDDDDDDPRWTPIAGMVDVLELEGPCGVTKKGTIVCAPLPDPETPLPRLRGRVIAGISTARHIRGNFVQLEGGDVVSIEHENGVPKVNPQPGLHGLTSLTFWGFTWSPLCGIARGKVTCWTRGEKSVAHAFEAVEVKAGNHHACAVDTLGAVWCWGDDRDGQLGRGRVVDRAEPRRVVEIGPVSAKQGP